LVLDKQRARTSPQSLGIERECNAMPSTQSRTDRV